MGLAIAEADAASSPLATMAIRNDLMTYSL